MSDLFRSVLLGTSRVVWSAEPSSAIPRTVITLRSRSRAALAREYLVLAGGAYDHDARHRALDALEQLVAGCMDPEDRPPELRRLRSAKRIERANRLLARHLDQAATVAHRLVDHDGDVVGMTKTIAAGRPSRAGWEPMAERDVFRHGVLRFLPTVHLSLPLVAVRMPEFAARYLELAPPAIPVGMIGVVRTTGWPFKRLEGLLADERWVFAALDAAERWRELMAQRSAALAAALVQVRADWTED